MLVLDGLVIMLGFYYRLCATINFQLSVIPMQLCPEFSSSHSQVEDSSLVVFNSSLKILYDIIMFYCSVRTL